MIRPSSCLNGSRNASLLCICLRPSIQRLQSSSKEDDIWWYPTQRSIEGFRIVPHICDTNSLTSAPKSFFNRLHQAGSDTLTANANVDDELAKVRAKSQVMSAREA